MIPRAARELRHFLARRRIRLVLRITAVICVGLVGGWIGLRFAARTDATIGPADVTFTLRPGASGGTVIDLPPLGTLRFDTHTGPLRLVAQVTRIRPDPARRLIEDPASFDRLTNTIGDQIQHAVTILCIKAALAALACAALAGLIFFRSWRHAVGTTTAAFNGLVAIGLLCAFTFNPRSIEEPRFTGILTNAPQLVGDAKSIVSRIGVYRSELARLVGNLSQLYDVTSTLPTYEPDPDTIRVLHVSDIHLNPVAWGVIRQVVSQFHIQLVIDTGDLVDHGTKAEAKFADSISKVKAPYVFIKGNHDSPVIVKAVRKQKNAIVLDQQMRQVGGLRIYGIPDPRFTPDKTTRDDYVGDQQMLQNGRAAAQKMGTENLHPDIVLTHDPAEGQAFDGLTPLVLCGHLHRRTTRIMTNGTRLFVQGSTGGAGMRGLEHEQPTPIELSVLYFDKTSHRLQGWDDIRLGGLGLSSAQIQRTLESKPDRPIGPPPGQPSPNISATPVSPTPSAGRSEAKAPH